MKRTEIFLFISLFIGLALSAQDNVKSILKELKDLQSDHVFVVAHRGDWRNAPENSLSG